LSNVKHPSQSREGCFCMVRACSRVLGAENRI
jgi:hypothetical protein